MCEKINTFIGIDVSKNTLDIYVLGDHYKIKNNLQSIYDFFNVEITLPKSQCFCALESTGGYEKDAIIALNKLGIKVHRAHPSTVHAFAKASKHFAKTDKLDARLLEKYARFVYEEDTPLMVLDAQNIDLQMIQGVIRDLQADLHACQCRIHHLCGKARIILEERISFTKSQIKQAQNDLQEIIDKNAQLTKKQQILTTYKGVGEITANVLICELPELGRLNKKEIAALVGLAPKTNDSGTKTGKAHIKGGRFNVRKALYMVALVASRGNARMKEVYQKMIAAGKAPKVALTALMRRILVHLNAMIKDQTTYQG